MKLLRNEIAEKVKSLLSDSLSELNNIEEFVVNLIDILPIDEEVEIDNLTVDEKMSMFMRELSDLTKRYHIAVAGDGEKNAHIFDLRSGRDYDCCKLCYNTPLESYMFQKDPDDEEMYFVNHDNEIVKVSDEEDDFDDEE